MAQQRIDDDDDFAIDMAAIKAVELVGKVVHTADDFEDITQDMLLDLLERLDKYDPAKSDFKLFATCVIDRKARNLVRHRESKMRDCRRESGSLNEEIAESDGPVQRLAKIDADDHDIRKGKYSRPSEERSQLHLDVESVLARLPPELRKAAELLQTMSITEAAREMGVPRATFYHRYIQKLRDAFTDKGMKFYVQ